jgi:hypothetical protein
VQRAVSSLQAGENDASARDPARRQQQTGLGARQADFRERAGHCRPLKSDQLKSIASVVR